MPYYELYKADFDAFKQLFLALAPWGEAAGEMADVLAERAFRLMDRNSDGLLNFMEVIQFLHIVCKGGHVMKLKLLYCLHLPGVVLPGELDSPADTIDGAEVAADASDFFSVASANDSIDATPGGLKDLLVGGGGDCASALGVDGGDDAAGRTELTERRIGSDAGASLQSLQSWLLRQESKAEMKRLPSLPHKHFVHLWRTLHDLFVTDDSDQQLYHSVSIVGTLLLQIGEVGQKITRLQKQSSASSERRSPDCASSSSQPELPPQSAPQLAAHRDDDDDDDVGWAITFEQFLASVLNESCLVEYFDRQVDIVEKLTQFNQSRLLSRESVSPMPLKSKSIFYV